MTANLTCKDMMLKDQVVLRPDDTVSRAFTLMRRQGMRFLPVVKEDGTYIGVFTSPSLIRLLLPQAITIQMGGKNANKGLNDLRFFNLDQDSFEESLKEVKDEPVANYLSDPKNIPTTAPDTPIMEGILLLHKYKRHVILIEPDSKQFVGVLSNNSTLQHIFDEDYEL